MFEKNQSAPDPVTPDPNKPVVPAPPKTPIKQSGSISSAGIAALIVFLLIVVGVSGYFVFQTFIAPNLGGQAESELADQTQDQEEEPAMDESNVKQLLAAIFGTPAVQAHDFATYSEPEVNILPQVPKYEIASDLSNVENADDFFLSDQAKSVLAKNGFVVTTSYSQEFFPIYESNRYAFNPSFITTDSMFHNYHLAFDFLLRRIETNKFKDQLVDLTYKMVLASKKQYEDLQGTVWENAARRNVAFFTVANKLVYPEAVPADYVKDLVDAEIQLIENHEGIASSAIMNFDSEAAEGESAPMPAATPENLEANGEDYSQYIPRGHYTRSEDLQVYFKSMMYLGRLTFRLKDLDETRSALLITQVLNSDQEIQDLWEAIYEPTAFLVGKADDLSFKEYFSVITPIYGSSFDAADLLEEDKLASAMEALDSLPDPAINSMPIFDARFQPDRNAQIKGFRFMGQRYTLDADIFQRLVYREVGDKQHACGTDPADWIPEESRRLPSGLDVAAAFGSDLAFVEQQKKGETDYACYQENLDKMKDYVAGLGTDKWVQNVYWGWLYALRPLVSEKIEGYPMFMQNDAWQYKDLNTFLGSWAELKHDTILYAKQVYAEMGGGLPEEKDDRGYVEPNPYVYARLAALTKMTKEGLELRSLLSESDSDLLNRLYTLAITLKQISEKELNNEELTEADYEFIRSYGGSLEHIWIEANKDLGIESQDQLSEERAAIVADVATDPSGMVLEEGVGNVFSIYVVVPAGDKLLLAKGGVFSYYEFPWPLSDRLTDEKWRQMLDEGSEPNLPVWTANYLAE